MTVDEVEKILARSQSEFDATVGEARSVVANLQKVKAEISSLESRIEYLEKISILLNSYADERQIVVQKQIESVVTKGLCTIFGEELVFRIDNRMVGRRSEIDFVLVSNSGGKSLETSILDARGGGVAAVAGFLVQATMVLLTPGMNPVLFLDEVFAQVSAEYEEPLADFISELVNRSPLQVVLVTHSTAFSQSADRGYRFSQKDGITSITEEVI